jgi:hypothetical protein
MAAVGALHGIDRENAQGVHRELFVVHDPGG